MLELGACPASGHPQSERAGPRAPPAQHRYFLLPPESEGWRKHRLGLAEGPFPGPRLQVPDCLSEDWRCPGETLPLGPEGDFPVSPNAIKRRRGGLIEQRDIIKAHQAHKIQSTPQARRKEWE